MALDQSEIINLSQKLHDARTSALPIPQFGNSISEFSQMDAYSIQEAGIRLREEQGEKQIGLKMGLTSEAKRKQMNLESPLYGVLTDKMKIENQSMLSLKGFIHPKIEPEIAFLIHKDIGGNVTREQVLDSCEGVCAALEILDSRYEQFKYFSMQEVISDNSSSSHFVLGPLSSFSHLDLVHLKMKLSIHSKVVQEGSAQAISGDPVLSVVQLCQLLHQRKKILPAGSIVLAGAATPAVTLEEGMKIRLEVDSLEPVEIGISK